MQARHYTKIFLTILLLHLLQSPSIAAPVLPSVLAATGEVESGGASLGKNQPIAAGATLTSKEHSGAMLSPVPGQFFFLDGGARARFLNAEVKDENGPVRSSTFFLGSGHVHSSAEKPKTGSTTQEVRTPCGRLTSNDGNWSTWSTEGPEGITQHAAVYHGTVTIARSGAVVALADALGGSPASENVIKLTEGQVASWKCDDPTGAIEVVDLRTGRVITYIQGQEVGSVPATRQQMLAARGLFEQGIAPFLATSTEGGRIDFAQLLESINRKLAEFMLPNLPLTTEWQLFPDWNRNGVRAPSDLASPEKPNL